MSEHAVYAPSSAHRWLECTASATAIAALGDSAESLLGEDEREDGEAAHFEIERILGPYSGDGHGLWLEKDSMLAVDNDHPAAYGIALVIKYVCGLAPGTLWIEQRIRLTDKIWGRCDVAHWCDAESVLTIIDYKNGFVNVEAERNAQLRCYAAGSIYTHKLPAKWIRYVVVQPNSFLPVPRVKQWVESADDLFKFAEHAAAIPDGPLTFTAGEQCTYCPMFGRCPASRDVLVRLGVALANAPDAIPLGQVALFMAMRKPIEDWFKAADKAQTKNALAGRMPPGMKLVATQKHRAWKDGLVDRLKESIAAEHGVKALELPTPAQAEKQNLLSVGKVAEYSERPDGGPALAFENDKRPKWEPKSVEKMFAPVLNKSDAGMVPVVRA